MSVLPAQRPPRAARPTSVTVLAVLGIVLGAFGVIGGLCGLAPLLGAPTGGNPLFDLIRRHPVLFGWTICSTAVSWLLAIVLLSASIAALALRPWARATLLLYAGAALVLNVLGLLVQAVFLAPRMAPWFSSPDPLLKISAISGAVGSCLGFVIGLLYPIFVLVFLRKPHVVAAFAPREATPPA